MRSSNDAPRVHRAGGRRYGGPRLPFLGRVVGKIMFEHRDSFIGALRAGPGMRTRVFDTLEERFAHDLGTGRAGKILYDALHSVVRDAGVTGAEEEFEDPFCRFSIYGDRRARPTPLIKIG
jgi:hypothetical protein